MYSVTILGSHVVLLSLVGSGCYAFIPSSIQSTTFIPPKCISSKPTNQLHSDRTARCGLVRSPTATTTLLRMASEAEMTKKERKDAEIGRLRAMAAKLRAEAASLEAEKAKDLAAVAEKAFKSFDTNRDGEISVDELKAGLEKLFNLDLTKQRASELMAAFDASGDGMLQPDEFKSVDQFKGKLEALVREEKDVAFKAARDAKTEEESARLAQAKVELINEGPPTNFDKAVSILPYLFPLLDGLQYGRFLLANDDGSNPFVVVLAILYSLYRSIPLSGFVAFFALSFLSSNLQLNRLVRFNLQQAIFIDIALIIPGVLFGLATAALPAVGVQLPAAFTQVATDGTFIALLVALGYCVVRSVLGAPPDKLPFISNMVNMRMPTIDMFDDEGRFVGPTKKSDKDNDDKKDKK